MYAINYGVLHDGWNAVRHACKKTQQGLVWKAVVKFSAVCNLGFKPIRSGVWRKKMQEHLTVMSNRLTPDSEEFQQCALDQHDLDPKRFRSSSCDFQRYHEYFCRLPACVDGGAPVLKYMRWFSIDDCWSFYKPQWCLLKPVLKDMAKDAVEAEALAGNHSTSLWETEITDKLKDASKSLLDKAHGYCTLEVGVFMEIYTVATHRLRTVTVARVTDIKTPANHLHDLVVTQEGAYQNIFRETLQYALYTPANLEVICPRDSAAQADRNAQLLADLTLSLLSEWGVRFFSTYFSYPNLVASILWYDEQPECFRDEIASDWRLSRKLEMVGQVYPDAQVVLDDIIFFEQEGTRLLLATAEDDRARNTCENTIYVAQGLVHRFGDEKPPEDMHQHVRDLARARRDRGNLSLQCVYNCMLESGVLEGRGVSVLTVTDDQVAQVPWSHKRKRVEDVKPNDTPRTKRSRHKLNEILHPKKDWSTINVPTTSPQQFRGCGCRNGEIKTLQEGKKRASLGGAVVCHYLVGWSVFAIAKYILCWRLLSSELWFCPLKLQMMASYR